MSEVPGVVFASAEYSKVGPDYFGYYTHEIAELLSQYEDSLPSSQTSELSQRKSGENRDKETTEHCCNGADSFFSNSIGAGLSDLGRERLKTLLRQSVNDLTPEVDEMLDSVVAMCRLKFLLRSKNGLSSYASVASDCNAGRPLKKLRASSSLSLMSIHERASPINSKSCREGSDSKHIDSKSLDVTLSGKGSSNAVQKNCSCCHTTETSQWRSNLDGKCLCSACGISYRNEREFHSGTNINADKESEDVTLSGKGTFNAVQKNCSCCHTTESSQWRSNLDGKCLCSACGISYRNERVFHSGTNINADKESEEVDVDLQFLMENDSKQVEETMQKYSDELSATLGHMEGQLEELLDTVMSKCRPMTLTEKQNLRKLIQKLPPRNLDRVVEIIRRHKPSKKESCDEVFVDLEQEDNIMLWRLYFYVEAVKKAKELVS